MATLSKMEVSRAARQHVRAEVLVDTLQQSRLVDADDSEAAAVLSTLVVRYGDKNAQPPSTIVATQRTNCRRSSRLNHLEGTSNYTPPTTSESVAPTPIAKKVSPRSQLRAE